jgi:hypothetical protein
MEYGILIALGEDGIDQPVGVVGSREEADELIANYITHGPDAGCVAPWGFVIYRRGPGGWYSVREDVDAGSGFEDAPMWGVSKNLRA